MFSYSKSSVAKASNNFDIIVINSFSHLALYKSLCATKNLPSFVKEKVVKICKYFLVYMCVSQVSTIFSCIFLCLMSIINKDGEYI